MRQLISKSRQERHDEKMKNLRTNKPDILTASKRPTHVDEDLSKSRRPLASAIEVPTVMKSTNATEFAIRLPPLKAYSSKMFNIELNISHKSSGAEMKISSGSNCIDSELSGVVKQHATVSVTNNSIELQGSTGIPGRLHELVCQIDEDVHQTWKTFFFIADNYSYKRR